METDSQTVEKAFTPPGEEVPAAEQKLVENWWLAIERAREHDRPARAMYALDRRYAAGTADQSLAVDTNLIGNYIDILVDYLYAKDPDVDARPAEEVTSSMPEPPLVPPMPPTDALDPAQAEAEFALKQQAFMAQTVEREQREFARRQRRAERADFAATLKLVISRLWKKGRLKRAIKKQVRSCLSIGPGWIKAVMIVDSQKDPLVAQQIADLRDNLERVRAQRERLAEQAPEDMDAAILELEEQIAGLEPKLEKIVSKTFAIDFCAAEDITVSTDVRYIDDYVDASWISNRIFVKKSKLRERFPDLTEADVQAATSYWMRSPRDFIAPEAPVHVERLQTGTEDATAADQFVSDKSSGASSFAAGQGGSGPNEEAFARIEEIWDRESNHVKTAIEGLKKWAREPYKPRFASSRFYPFFYLAFYEVDGARHPQSMSSRLSKLQDEYGETRSSFRLTRKRSIPAVLFNKSQVSKESAEAIEKAVEQEYVGIDPQNPSVPLRDLFAPKPLAAIEPALYDTTPIVRDMEKLSGVQEALQSSATRRPNMTATEAEIEQSGFATRVQADQDAIDDMLNELATYTAEIALQALTRTEVERIAGIDAYWPEGLPIERLTDLVEVEIEAGSTGRPNRAAERQGWQAVLPLVREDIMAIQTARATGNEPLAKALIALLQETFRVFGVRGDVNRFIPEPIQASQLLPAPMGAPGAPAGAPGGLPAPPNGDEAPPEERDPRALTTGNDTARPQLQ